MRLLVLALMLWGQTPGDAWGQSAAPLTLTGRDALHRATLPFEAYRDARRDLADVRVVNGKGEAVPFAWAGTPEAAKEEAALVDLPIFPVTHAVASGVSLAGAEVSVRTADGSLVQVRPPAGKVPPPTIKPTAYLLDASQVTLPMRALVLAWREAPGTEIVNVRVEASDDLRAWSGVASGPVVKLQAEGRTLAQPRVEFAARKAKYLRITWSGSEFALEGARAELEPAIRAPTRATRVVVGTAGPKPGEFVFDLGARLPVEMLRLVLNEPNSVAAATLFARDEDQSPWGMVTSATFYRLQREGAEQQSPAVDARGVARRHWLARFSAGSVPGSAPSLEVQWRPADIVFVARGDPPFALTFGNAAAVPVALPVSTLMPGYERGAELKLPQATVGSVTSGPPPGKWEAWLGAIDGKRVGLWAILVLGVAFLGFMAWRLGRQMR